jgi:hypothetical protein
LATAIQDEEKLEKFATSPVAKRDKLCGKQQKTVLRESNSDLEVEEAVVKKKGGLRKLNLDARSSS